MSGGFKDIVKMRKLDLMEQRIALLAAHINVLERRTWRGRFWRFVRWLGKT